MVLGKLDIDMRDKVGLLPYTIYKNYSSFPLSTPLQYSCLENPMDGGAWWAAVHGVTQSRTRLKRLSSSSAEINLVKTLEQMRLPGDGGERSGRKRRARKAESLFEEIMVKNFPNLRNKMDIQTQEI